LRSYADFVFDVTDHLYKTYYKISEEYKINAKEIDYSLSISDDDIEYERKYANMEVTDLGLLHSSAVQRKISEWLPMHNSILLHSVCIDINGVGVAFSAQSGTGKSTHLANWYSLLNGTENMPKRLKALLVDKDYTIEKNSDYPDLKIVNGDKPIIRFNEEKEKTNVISAVEEEGNDIPYAYGTPWNGKEHLGCNMRTALKHICFIERSETNYVSKIEKSDAINRIMQQVYMPKDSKALSQTLKLVDRLVGCCELWVIHCNMQIESADVAYKEIFGSKK